MFITIETTPGIGQLLYKYLQFPPNVIVLPQCESTSIFGTLETMIHHLRQANSLAETKTVICSDWGDTMLHTSELGFHFMKRHVKALEREIVVKRRRVFLSMDKDYAFELIINNGNNTTGTYEIDQFMKSVDLSQYDAVIHVPSHSLDTGSLRRQLIDKILGYGL
jgi:hypothetical protein